MRHFDCEVDLARIRGAQPPQPPRPPQRPLPPDQDMRFNGPVYDPDEDNVRLTGQIKRVFDLMRDGEWRTLDEIAHRTGDPPSSVSAQLRHLRKLRFGLHTVDKRSRGERSHGLWEYRLTVNPAGPVDTDT